MPSASGVARDVYEDRGENLDVVQILGVGGGVVTGQSVTGLFYGSLMAQDNITAKAGGGQQTSGSSVIVSALARVTIVATTNDSVTLPLSVRGMEVVVVNDGANSLNIFPALGDQINSLAANAAFADASAQPPVIFYCFSTGFWRTK